MNKRLKRDLILIAFGVCLFAALNNLGLVFGFLRKLFAICLPLILGGLLAFVLNVPMRAYEKLLSKLETKFKKNMSGKVKNLLSLTLAILSILLVLVIVFTIAIPKISESVKSVIITVDSKIPDFLIFLEENGIDTTTITEKLANFNLEQIIKQVTQGAFAIVETAFDATVIAVKYFSATVFAIIISIYLLLDKNNLSRQTRKMCYTFLPDKKADGIYKTAYLIRDSYAKFLSGQCLEAVILALLLFILLSIFAIPYASLIALLAAVLSFIPYIGSFIACAIGVVLAFIVSPHKALVCLIVYLAAQFIEQHFIYPHVVGNSVGLSPFYTIVAVLLGGNLFGIFGMIFFIPLFSVIYTLVRDFSTEKEKEKKSASEKPQNS